MAINLQKTFDTVRIPCVQRSVLQGSRFRDGNGTANDAGLKYYNCFPVNIKSDPWLISREGLDTSGGVDVSVALNALISAASTNCMYNITVTQLNDVYVAAIWDGVLNKIWIVQYRINAGTVTKIGELTGANNSDDIYLTELNIANTPYLGVVYHTMGSTNSKAYYAASSGGVFTAASLTQITDGDFPSNLGTPDHITGPMVQLDGTTYVLGKSGAIYGSDLNSITSWNPLNKIQAIQYPDEGISLARFKHYLVVFGEDSTEFFSDVGNAAPSSPLQRTDQLFVRFGAITPRSVLNTGDVLYWLGHGTNGTLGLYKLDGNYTPTKLTGVDEDAILSSAYASLAFSTHVLRIWPISLNGTKHIMICLAGSEVALGIANNGTFSGDTNNLLSSDVYGGHLCMAVEEELFWIFRAAMDKQFFPMAMGQFQTTNHSSQIQYMLGAYAFADGSGGVTNIGSTVFQTNNLVNTDGYIGGDFNFSSGLGGTRQPYTVAFQLPDEDFGNNKLKRVHQMILNYRGFTTTSAVAVVWLIWNKNKNTEDSSVSTPYPNMGRNKLGITLPVNNYRIYCNNLGAARFWTFGVIYKGFEAPAFRDIELEMSQGTR